MVGMAIKTVSVRGKGTHVAVDSSRMAKVLSCSSIHNTSFPIEPGLRVSILGHTACLSTFACFAALQSMSMCSHIVLALALTFQSLLKLDCMSPTGDQLTAGAQTMTASAPNRRRGVGKKATKVADTQPDRGLFGRLLNGARKVFSAATSPAGVKGLMYAVDAAGSKEGAAVARREARRERIRKQHSAGPLNDEG